MSATGPASPALRPITLVCKVALLALTASRIVGAQPQSAPPKPPADTVLFTNGDQLTGTLERGLADSIVFKSDMAGELTIPLSKIKELHASGSFAVLLKGTPITRKAVIPGTVSFAEGKLTVTQPAMPVETIPSDQLAYIIDQPTYAKELANKPGLLQGWTGSVNGGATVVRATDYGETFTAGIALARAIPDVAYLPARNRTTFNLQETYGKLTAPVIPQPAPPNPAIPAAVTLTSIFHTDAERDEYVSARFYALAQTSFDHNYAQGLSLQQVYGGGFGWTPVKTAKQQLDLKVTVQYEKQAFLQPIAIPPAVATPVPSQNIIGSTIGENYLRHLPGKLLFTESLSILPAFNNPQAYSANGSVNLALPVYKRLSVNFGTSDSFLNDPAAGYKKNSFQFLTSISYTLK